MVGKGCADVGSGRESSWECLWDGAGNSFMWVEAKMGSMDCACMDSVGGGMTKMQISRCDLRMRFFWGARRLVHVQGEDSVRHVAHICDRNSVHDAAYYVMMCNPRWIRKNDETVHQLWRISQRDCTNLARPAVHFFRDRLILLLAQCRGNLNAGRVLSRKYIFSCDTPLASH